MCLGGGRCPGPPRGHARATEVCQSNRELREPVGVAQRSFATGAVIVAVVLAAFGRAVAGASNPGPSAPLSRVTKHSGCHGRGSLPDHACTPGARFTSVTTA